MFKKFFMSLCFFVSQFACAGVEVNQANQVALDGIKGIGPKTSQTILDERKKNGPFKNWSDFQNRVSGIGPKSASKLSQNGLTVDGLPYTKINTVNPDVKKK